MSRMQDKIDHDIANIHAGIDVSKKTLDMFLRPINTYMKFSNDDAGIKDLIHHCTRYHVKIIAMEATGKYHCKAHHMLHQAGFHVSVINPYRSRKFADALGKLAKSDPIDASVLADFAALLQPKITIPPSSLHKALRDLNVARRQVLEEVGNLKRQLYVTDHPLAARQIRARIKMCVRHKVILEDEMKKLIATNEKLKRRFDILTSIPGIATVTATTFLAELDELGQVSCRQIAALAGVAPMNRDSGLKRGTRSIRGGRVNVRNMLYMCAVGQIRRDSQSGIHYRRLLKLGKNPKVALTAVMRKLVILANTLVTEDRHWQPTAP